MNVGKNYSNWEPKDYVRVNSVVRVIPGLRWMSNVYYKNKTLKTLRNLWAETLPPVTALVSSFVCLLVKDELLSTFKVADKLWDEKRNIRVVDNEEPATRNINLIN